MLTNLHTRQAKHDYKKALWVRCKNLGILSF